MEFGQAQIRYMEKINELITTIHAAPQLAVIAVAGGGSLAVAWLLAVPGASRTLLESVVPYSRLGSGAASDLNRACSIGA